MKKIFLYILLLASFCFTTSLKAYDKDDLVGRWDGYSAYKNNPLYFKIDFYDDSIFRGFFSSDEQRAYNIPLSNLKVTKDSVFFELRGDNDTCKFRAYYYHNKAGGTVEKGELSTDFKLQRGDLPDSMYSDSEVTFRNGDVVLSGTLFIPFGSGPFPAIIFTQGSGNEGREASAYLADYFAKKGIVTLIYDKRGVNKSTGDWHNSGFIDLANDCLAGVKLLWQNPKVVRNKVGVYGQSQGGTICPLILTLDNDIAFGISAGSAGVPMFESELYGARYRYSAVMQESDVETALSLLKMQIDYALTGDGWNKIEDANIQYSGEKWYDDNAKLPPKDDWWYSFYKKIGNYNPVDYWKKVKQPVLLLKGDHDQVCPGYPSFQNVEEALKRAGNQNYRIVYFNNSDHAFHVYNRSYVFWFKSVPNYCETIYDWLNKNKFVPDKKALKLPDADEDDEE
jgi:alpha-beta hydrolase superfamily lysophospholipase